MAGRRDKGIDDRGVLKHEMCQDCQHRPSPTRGASSAAERAGLNCTIFTSCAFLPTQVLPRPPADSPGASKMAITRLARRLQGDCRPPVWRAVVRPARSFFIGAKCGILPLRASAGGLTYSTSRPPGTARGSLNDSLLHFDRVVLGRGAQGSIDGLLSGSGGFKFWP